MTGCALKTARLSGWDQALSEYLAAKRAEPFAYATNDCCTFAAGAVLAMTGVDPMAEYRGRYFTRLGSLRALRTIGPEHSRGSVKAAWNVRFATVPVGLAQRGDLAFYQESVGVIAGAFAWFVSEDGLVRVPMRKWEKAWKV